MGTALDVMTCRRCFRVRRVALWYFECLFTVPVFFFFDYVLHLNELYKWTPSVLNNSFWAAVRHLSTSCRLRLSEILFIIPFSSLQECGNVGILLMEMRGTVEMVVVVVCVLQTECLTVARLFTIAETRFLFLFFFVASAALAFLFDIFFFFTVVLQSYGLLTCYSGGRQWHSRAAEP